MEHIKINLTNPVYGIKEFDVRYIIDDGENLLVVFNESYNHKLNEGQTLSFVRYIYTDNDDYYQIKHDVIVVGFETYNDEGETFDAVRITKPIIDMLTLDRTEEDEIIYWDFDGTNYVSSTTSNVPISEYLFDYDGVTTNDYSSATHEELDALWPYYYTTTPKIVGISEYNVVFPVGMYPTRDVMSEMIIDYVFSGTTEPPQEAINDIFGYLESTYSVVYNTYHSSDEVIMAMENDGLFDEEITQTYFVLQFTTEHHIFQQDIESLNGNSLTGDYYINVYNSDKDLIGTLSGLYIPYATNSLKIQQDDTLTTWEEDTCGMFDEFGNPYKIKHHKYTFNPTTFSRNKLIVTKCDTPYITQSLSDTRYTFNLRKLRYVLENGYWFEPVQTPYYFPVQVQNQIQYTLWGDIWWSRYDLMNGNYPITDIWANSGNTHTALVVDDSYWCVPSLFLVNNEYTSIGNDDEIHGYINGLISDAIPETIDFERIKYVPCIENDNGITLVSEITYNFHFRKRVRKTGPEYSNIPMEHRQYEDGWYVNQDSGTTVWWNGMNYNSSNLNNSIMHNFVNNYGGKSDLLGYLNFNDDDVYYGKSKIKNTFVRFSFYTSKDPVSQKLLFYSTAFFDENELRGKYLRLFVKNGRRGTLENPYVFEDDQDNRLDSRITLTNEFNNKKSSEGFNIYLFLEDAPSENTEKTIYMKVEFNHAGNGKTIPMIIWPKNANDVYQPLTTANFLENLYIPIKIKYIDGVYVYVIDGVNVDGDKISLDLFEPKLDIVSEIGNVGPINPDIPITGQTNDQYIDYE